MIIKKRIKVENQYSGSNWNFEKTTKYIIEDGENLLEAGYFEHYREKDLVKVAIELPVSYGCPAKCRFCASSAIKVFHPFEAQLLVELLDYIYEENQADKQPYVLLTMTGTGDLTFNFHNVSDFLKQAVQKYNNIHVTLSSCMCNAEYLERVDELSKDIPIRNIQITYISDREDTLESVVPAYRHRPPNFDEVLTYLSSHPTKRYFRINYILIEGVNDSEEDFERFAERIQTVKDQVCVRISKLNETMATKRNHLKTTPIEKLKQFQEKLSSYNIDSYVFYAKNNDNMNCGQLITETELGE